jgi:hypothetical protein
VYQPSHQAWQEAKAIVITGMFASYAGAVRVRPTGL